MLRPLLALALASAFCLCCARAIVPTPTPSEASTVLGFNPLAWDTDAAREIERAAGTAGLRLVAVGGRDAWVIEHAVYPECSPVAECLRDLRTIRVDLVCASRHGGRLAIRAVLVHEMLHARYAEHICRYPGELPIADGIHDHERCSSVGYGRAVLNPFVRYSGPNPDGLDDVTDEPTALDWAEVARARHGSHW